jgi:hypothetical protein
MGWARLGVLSVGQCCGLEYRRPNGSQHMIIVGRLPAGSLACLDFQSPAANRPYVAFPPENGVQYGYRAWLIDEIAELKDLSSPMNLG